ncbi:hypothetical protein OG979_17150 [Actinomadura citrea]|uniref:hypothetical protein n=1 Tax=Actinomadura citrea TaxID=46158 RepID=UPI002E2DF109|nr:hypothetical protein [Actinomadura citrea]
MAPRGRASNDLHESQWFRLIELWEVGHPADVIMPYQGLIVLPLAVITYKHRHSTAVKVIVRLGRRTGDQMAKTASPAA